jgi:hypothetical protein
MQDEMVHLEFHTGGAEHSHFLEFNVCRRVKAEGHGPDAKPHLYNQTLAAERDLNILKMKA